VVDPKVAQKKAEFQQSQRLASTGPVSDAQQAFNKRQRSRNIGVKPEQRMERNFLTATGENHEQRMAHHARVRDSDEERRKRAHPGGTQGYVREQKLRDPLSFEPRRSVTETEKAPLTKSATGPELSRILKGDSKPLPYHSSPEYNPTPKVEKASERSKTPERSGSEKAAVERAKKQLFKESKMTKKLSRPGKSLFESRRSTSPKRV